MSPSRGLILVVEDDPPIASGLVRGLKLAGFEVSLATDGRLALEAVEREKPVLVVLDINLPEVDGFELLETWRTRRASRPRSMRWSGTWRTWPTT